MTFEMHVARWEKAFLNSFTTILFVSKVAKGWFLGHKVDFISACDFNHHGVCCHCELNIVIVVCIQPYALWNNLGSGFGLWSDLVARRSEMLADSQPVAKHCKHTKQNHGGKAGSCRHVTITPLVGWSGESIDIWSDSPTGEGR